MANVSYDTLTIEINADSKQASSSIKKLSNNLEHLEDVAKNLDFGAIRKAQECLQDIAKIDFTNVSNGLKDVVNSFKAFNNSKFMKVTQNGGDLSGAYQTNNDYQPNFEMVDNNALVTTKNEIAKIDEGTQKLKQALKDIFSSAEADVMSLKEQLQMFVSPEFAEKLASLFENFRAGISPTLDDVSRVRNEMIRLIAIERLNNGDDDNSRLDGLKTILSILSQIKTQAKSAKNTLDGVKNSVKKSGDEAKKGASKWSKLIGAFKRVAFYRVVRRALQLVAQTLKQGFEELAGSDTAFNDSISRIKNSLTYLGNSIVSAVAPILEAITPIIEMLADGLAQVVSLFGQITASEAGDNQFSEATKGAEDYAESLKKVKNASLGIDELNVVSQDKSETHFQQVEVTPSETGFKQAFSDLANAIQPIFDALKDVIVAIRPILETISPVLDSLKPILVEVADLIKSLAPIIQLICELFKNLINKTAPSVNKAIASIIKAIASVVKLIGAILTGLQPILDVVIDVIGTVINLISDVIKVVFDMVSTVLTPLIAFIKKVFEIFKPILDVISKLLSNVFSVVEKLWNSLGVLFESTLYPITQMLELITPLLEKIAPLLEILARALGGALGLDDGSNTGSRIFWGILSGGASEGLRQLWENGGARVNDAYTTPSANGYTSNSNQGSSVSSNGTTQINVYIDSEEVASRVNQINDNRGTSTFKRGKLTYAK